MNKISDEREFVATLPGGSTKKFTMGDVRSFRNFWRIPFRDLADEQIFVNWLKADNTNRILIWISVHQPRT